MANPLVQLWLYNDWANNLLLKKMKQEAGDLPPICLRLFSHMMNAQLIWLYRLNGEKPTVGVWDEHTLTECEQYHRLSSSGIGKKVCDEETTSLEMINYTNTMNEHFQDALEDILLHVFNHGTYHRAQIAFEMRRVGIDPINTDYISFVRTSRKRNEETNK